LGPARPGGLVEDRYPRRWNPAIDGRSALDPSLNGLSAVDPSLDGYASVDSTFDGIETIDEQPPVDWIYAFNELAEPRLFRAPTGKHTIKPIWGRQQAIRRVPRRGWAEAIEVERSGIQKVPSAMGPLF